MVSSRDKQVESNPFLDGDSINTSALIYNIGDVV